jgi:hypothetical protein
MGCVYALSASAVQQDGRIPPGERDRLFRSHGRQALHWLKSAADRGFFRDAKQRDGAKKDSDLGILRDRPEFRQLLEEGARKPAESN